MAVRNHLNAHLPRRWIGRAGANDVMWCRWPPKSPDLTTCDFFLWGYIKDKVFVPPLQRSLPELRPRITTAIASITRDTLHKAWDELDYRLDICRVTRGAHIESLWGVYRTLRVFLSTGVGVKFQVRRICFMYHFESVMFFVLILHNFKIPRQVLGSMLQIWLAILNTASLTQTVSNFHTQIKAIFTCILDWKIRPMHDWTAD
jgi:hypothetical protein